jgi:hypothetical protein
MDELLTVEPFGFFTRDTLRAGWYLVWRQLIRVVPLALGALLIGAALGGLGMGVFGAVVGGLGLCAAFIWAVVLIPRLASQWAVVHYGYPLTGQVRVWWAIVWRVFVVALIAAVILTPPNFVALSLSTSFKGSTLGGLGKLLTAVLGLANFGVTVLATGWAMSRVTAMQLSGLPVALLPLEPAPIVSEPTPVPSSGETISFETPAAVAAPAPLTMPVAVAAPAPLTMAVAVAIPAAVAAPVAPAPAEPVPQPARGPAAIEGKRQCPKCSLYETERGSVIGWYCTICGWRETRR